jgi:hypothetical protein
MATVTIKAPEGTCGCGCGAETAKGRSYKQGHDARLRSILGKAYKAGDDVSYNGKVTSAEVALKAHGFPIPPAAKPRAKRTASKKTAAKKTAAKKTSAKKSTAKRSTAKRTAKVAAPVEA